MGQDNSSALALTQVEDFLREQAISKGRLVSLQTGDLLFEANDLSEELQECRLNWQFCRKAH
jgi:hypothetical protein